MYYVDDIERILIPDFEIEKKVAELGAKIARDYAAIPRPLLMLGALRGGFVFLADLARAADLPVEIDFISLSSYGGGTESSGNVRLEKDLDQSIEGRDVLIVEDIIDTGISLAFMKNLLSARKPASLKLCALLDKPSRRKTDVRADYTGFTVPDEFLVGYGMDYGKGYRNLRDVCVLKIEIILKNE
jgi:hypoxanthine phosphoribosyltransferase